MLFAPWKSPSGQVVKIQIALFGAWGRKEDARIECFCRTLKTTRKKNPKQLNCRTKLGYT